MFAHRLLLGGIEMQHAFLLQPDQFRPEDSDLVGTLLCLAAQRGVGGIHGGRLCRVCYDSASLPDTRHTPCNDKNIRFISFLYSENTGQFKVIKEQVGTFSDSIKLWDEPVLKGIL